MARYTGPTEKISRRFGVPLFGPSKSLERRAYGPGQHGPRGGRRRKQSDYAIALAEKQKLRFQYGVLEKQFRRYFAAAQRQRGVTGILLLQLLEMRLDNICYRFGLGLTRRASRQFVNHGHILVNGQKVDIPSYQCQSGDVITIGGHNRSQQLAMRLLDATQARPESEWLTVDKDNLAFTVNRAPERDEIDPMVNEQLVVELYSR
ncbi:MAG: 30S ribosomal protein S4 [Verrucomicrobia bacterium]|nr:30S ribosomal protein S4 [Verrucomicrobiota bacterium]